MLFRASSDAGSRLRRSKSSSTVPRHAPAHQEPFDSGVAQQHALAAATAAFVRAHGSDALDRGAGGSGDLTRSKSNASKKSEGRHFPPRGSSLRAAQPQKKAARAASPRPQSHAMPLTGERVSAGQSESGRPISQRSAAVDESMRPTSQPKPNRASFTPSATSQQIRKARSMYNASSVQTGSPVPRSSAKFLAISAAVSPALDDSTASPTGQATPPLVSPRMPATLSGDQTVEKARDQCLQDFQQRQVRHRPSLFLSFKKRHEKGKNKGGSESGSASIDTHRTPVAPLPVQPPSEDKVPKQKRSFSNSLKNKFKKVFRKSSHTSTSLPVQQIDAKREYFGDTGRDSPQSTVQSNLEIPSPDEQTLMRNRSRTPSCEIGKPFLVRPGSRSSSARSEADVSNAPTSRVTSWSTSSAGNTITSREVKRLSVIHEAKNSISSVSSLPPASPKRRPLVPPNLSAFRDPIPMESLAEEATLPIDPKRVFSALMKEIDSARALETQPHPGDDDENSDQSDVFVDRDTRMSPPSTDLLGSVDASAGVRRARNSTIRAVSPETPPMDGTNRARSIHGAVRLPRSELSTPSSIGDSDTPKEDTKPMQTSSSQGPAHEGTKDAVPEVVTPTSEQIERRVQKSQSRWTSPLEADHFPFFPRSPTRTYTYSNLGHLDVSAKPFDERLLGETRAPSGSLSAAGEQAPQALSPEPKGVKSPLSPSVYSRATDGASFFQPNDSILSLDQSAMDDADSGTAVIITSHPVKSFLVGTPTHPRTANHSAQSSKDWKAWLSHEVSELEDKPKENLTFHERNPSTRHQRESAQISDDSPLTETLQTTKRSEEWYTPRQVVDESRETHKATESLPEKRASEPRRRPLLEDSQKRAHRHTWHPLPPTDHRCSTPSTQRSDGQRSERMNERFPIVESGRRHSQQSYSSRTLRGLRTPGTDSPTARSTPSPKIYSDFSPPASQEAVLLESRHGPANGALDNKENRREALSTPPINKSLCVPPCSLSRPQSLQPLQSPSSWHRPSSSLARYTTSTEEGAEPKRTSSPAAMAARPRIRSSRDSVGSLGARPKSAYDLGAQRGPPASSPLGVPATDKRVPRPSHIPVPRKAALSPAPEDDAGVREASPRLSPAPLHTKRSSSRLALNKEPSPGPVERVIDSVLDDRDGDASCRGSTTPTAGQRMAEQFLRERTATSNASSPVNMSPVFL